MREKVESVLGVESQDEREENRAFFDVPEPDYVFGSYAGHIIMNVRPAGPSDAEIKNRALLDAASAIKDPWAGPTPPLYSSRRYPRR